MGQAKRRGSFEQRKQQSVEKAEALKIENARKEQDWWDSLTEEQQNEVSRRRSDSHKKVQSLLAATSMLSSIR